MLKPADLALLLKIVRYVSLAVSVFLIWRMFRTYRKVRAISRKSCLAMAGFPLATLLVYFLIIGSGLTTIVLVSLFSFGLGLGLFQGVKTWVWLESGRALAQNTVWFLAVWAVSYATMQLLVVIGSSMSLRVGIGSMFVSTAIALGSQGLLFIRLSQSVGLPVVHMTTPAGAGRGLGGRTESQTTAAKSAARRFCTACGTAASPGRDQFCRNCGTAFR